MGKRIFLVAMLASSVALATNTNEPTYLRLNLKPGDEYVHTGKTTITSIERDGTQSSATRAIRSSIKVKSKSGDKYVVDFKESSTYSDDSIPSAQIKVNVNSKAKSLQAFDILNQKANDAAVSSFFPFELPKKKVTVGHRWSQTINSNSEIAKVDYEIVERAKIKGFDVYVVNFYSDPARTPSQIFSGVICFDLKSGMVVRVNMKGSFNTAQSGQIKIAGNMELAEFKRGR